MSGCVPTVCLFLFILCFRALQGNAQQYSGVVQPENSMPINRQIGQVDKLESSNIRLASPHDSSRVGNIIAYKYRGEESNSSGLSSSTSWRTIAYWVVMASFVGVGLLASLALFLKSLIMKIKQKQMQETFSMTYHDAKLSSQFLSDLSGSERSDKENTPNLPTKDVTEKPVVIDIPTAMAPIPAQISLTSPKGETRKSTWQTDDFVRVDSSDDGSDNDHTSNRLHTKTATYKPVVIDIPTAPIPAQVSLTSPKGETRKSTRQTDDFVRVDSSDDGRQRRARRTSSLPSLSSDQYSSSAESRDSSRRDAVLLMGDDEDLLADLKKKSQKNKKAWKKIIKASQLRAS